LRYKDEKGDPRGFTTFLRQQNLPLGLLPRYRGNRLHVLFEYCRIFLDQKDNLQGYFDGVYGGASVGQLRSCISEDFKSAQGQLEIVALCIIGELLSAPWMAAFYRSADQQHSYHDAIIIIKNVLLDLKNVHDPLDLLTRTTDFFGAALSEATIARVRQHSALCDRGELQRALGQLLQAAASVIERQCQAFFNTKLSDEFKNQTKSGRTHNIDAEEIVGMFSDAQSRCPSANIDLLSSRIRSVKNKTLHFLDNLETDRREKLLTTVVAVARTTRLADKSSKSDLRAEIMKRQEEKVREQA
jgi:hypothetical protein